MGLEEFAYGFKSFRNPSNASSFQDIPLLDKLRHELIQTKTNKKGNSLCWDKGSTGRKRVQKPGKRSIPLAAYSCYSEKPVIISDDFYENSLHNVIDRSTLTLIRTLGYASLRPIGIGKTLKEMEQDRQTRQEKKKAHFQHDMAHQNSSFAFPALQPFSTAGMAAAETSEEESDQSYGYDNEYEPVEGPQSTMEATRGIYVEESQLVDASFVDRSAEQLNNERQFANENEDSVNEMPSLTISETAEAIQGSRVSSLTERLAAAMNEDI